MPKNQKSKKPAPLRAPPSAQKMEDSKEEWDKFVKELLSKDGSDKTKKEEKKRQLESETTPLTQANLSKLKAATPPPKPALAPKPPSPQPPQPPKPQGTEPPQATLAQQPPPPQPPQPQRTKPQVPSSQNDEEMLPDYDTILDKLEEVDLDMGIILAVRFARSWGEDITPIEGCTLAVEFLDNKYEKIRYTSGAPHDPFPPHGKPPATPKLNFSPVTSIQLEPSPPPPQTLGFSPITSIETEPVPEPAPGTPNTPSTKKRKGKQPSQTTPYQIKRQLNGKEARKIASSPSIDKQGAPLGATPTTTPSIDDHNTRDTVPPSAKTPSPKPKTPTPEPPKTSEAPKTPEKTTPPKKTKTPTGKTAKQPDPTSSPDATTSKHGVVVHGIALRKELGKVRRWLEDGNPDLGNTVGIRWLRKKTLLVEEGKKTSSIVVYLEGKTSVEKVRLGGKWLRVSTYESDRGRK